MTAPNSHLKIFTPIQAELLDFINSEKSDNSLITNGIWFHQCYNAQHPAVCKHLSGYPAQNMTTTPKFIAGSRSIDKKKVGFTILWKDVLDIPGLNITQKAILCRVISAAEHGGMVSNQDMASTLGIHRDTVNEGLGVLEERGLIVTNGRKGYGRRFDTVFTPPTFSRLSETPSISESLMSETPSNLDGTSRHNSISTLVLIPKEEKQNQGAAGEGEAPNPATLQRFNQVWTKYHEGRLSTEGPKGKIDDCKNLYCSLSDSDQERILREVQGIKTFYKYRKGFIKFVNETLAKPEKAVAETSKREPKKGKGVTLRGFTEPNRPAPQDSSGSRPKTGRDLINETRAQISAANPEANKRIAGLISHWEYTAKQKNKHTTFDPTYRMNFVDMDVLNAVLAEVIVNNPISVVPIEDDMIATLEQEIEKL